LGSCERKLARRASKDPFSKKRIEIEGQVSWPEAQTTPCRLFDDALATTKTVPEAPDTHCTVTVRRALATTFAMLPVAGLATMNCPV
jgi:hypothetical protein